MLETIQSDTVHRLVQIRREIEKQGDEARAEKLLDLIRKAQRREFTLAFCGHFSAGKSSMLNAWYKEELLPTSPIPTSANVVAVRSGEDRVVLTLRSGERRMYRGAYTEKELKALAKNGDEVIAVDVWREGGRLPEGTCLLDTPGIDSTDDAHRVATESALHMADILFYAMDYNHVQSEVNLQFVKELKQRGKRVYLVVNQIDKHREEELRFQHYRESVETSFRNWGIEVDGIFYTSLKDPSHPYNEWNRLNERMEGMFQDREALIEGSVLREAEYLIREHLAMREASDREKARQLLRDTESTRSVEELETAIDLYAQKREEHLQEAEEKEQVYLRGLEELFANVYLMPYEVRESARDYLETQLTDFRVGFLFSKGKTEKERERRRQTFAERLKETVDTQLDVHVREYVIRFLKEHGIYTPKRGEAIYGTVHPLDPQLLEMTVKSGAKLTREYVLKYTDDLSESIKQACRRQAKAWYEDFGGEIEEKLKARAAETAEELAGLKRELEGKRFLEKLEAEQFAYEARFMDLLQGTIVPETELSFLPEEEAEEAFASCGPSLLAGLSHPEPENQTVLSASSAIDPAGDETEHITEDPQAQVLRQAEVVEELLADMEGLTALREELADKRHRSKERQFTVALFGAFSAGKSSLANALMGNGVLPVSPNPTTATINRIGPPTESYGHGEAVIRFKSKETLLGDLCEVYRLFRREATSLEEALKGIDELLNLPITGPRQKTALPFLRAVKEGASSFVDRLGTSVVRSFGEFEAYVAREEKSCFVERVDLYVDCPLTRLGVTLVDTPGADSIHARHTDVAFRYIKDADAILFVTYYNHAFSRADREFLIQLGRVKDTFAMDKMFFIMNASDLAASDEEREEVQAYIGEQLLRYGIRHPRMFAVSSLRALEEKTGGNPVQPSGIAAFERDFAAFLQKDLQTVSLHSLKNVTGQAHQTVCRLLEAARQGNAEKEQKRAETEMEQDAFLRIITHHEGKTEEHALRREVEELLYYVKQRLFYRYPEVFAEIFSPGVLREDRGDIREIFRSCVLEMVDFIRHDLMQEFRATSLRLEGWLDGKLKENMGELTQECLGLNGAFPVPEPPSLVTGTPTIKTPFPDLSADSFKKTITSFKGSKSFFAKDDKSRVRQEIKEVLEAEVEKCIGPAGEQLFHHYQEAWRQAVAEEKERLEKAGRRYYKSVLCALSSEGDAGNLEERAAALSHAVQEMEKALN
ncbi:dynamin family protein [Salinithrix halophila]|uniref:Dynamin family protein n=1 Tax=Salinithrix halophila TaxID=1485204 RepID=A0ABV8JGT3_9BACL